MSDRDQPTTPTSPGHEPEAVHGRGVAWSAGGMALALGGTLMLMAWLVQIFQEGSPEHKRPSAAPASTARSKGPALDPDQSQELRRLRAQQERLLGEYHWLDQERKTARIPIARAIEITAARGLQRRTDSQEASDGK